MASRSVSDCLKVCSFNCRSIKNCYPVIADLCNVHDIVLIQEHWLRPDELTMLHNVHSDFHFHALSAMDLSNNILTGRPYGGTAILYRKSFADKMHVCYTDISRITAVTVDTDVGPMLVANVYLPTNYGDLDSLELYVDCLSKLQALIVDTNTVHVVVAGDFNCSVGSRFYDELSNFVLENNLVVSDALRMDNVFTYMSDNFTKCTWIDHVVCSVDADNLIDNICVLNDVIVSDHRPVSFSLQCKVLCGPVSVGINVSGSAPAWDRCDDSTLNYYACYLDTLLQTVKVPFHVYANPTRSDMHTRAIDKFYGELLDCIKRAVAATIPTKKLIKVTIMYLDGTHTLMKSTR